jgi:hypothetical protein
MKIGQILIASAPEKTRDTFRGQPAPVSFFISMIECLEISLSGREREKMAKLDDCPRVFRNEKRPERFS